MLGIFFNLFEKKFIKWLNKKNSIKLTVNNLAYAFMDLDGNAYYKFPKEMELPLVRTGKVQEFLMWLVKGVSKEEYLAALDVAEIALTDGIKNPKGVAKIGFVLHELKERCNMVVHDGLFYNILAAQLIRQDESPTEFNNEIHMQKVAAFIAMDNYSDAFFLATPELRAPLGLLNVTKSQLEELLKGSLVNRQALERMLKSL